MSKIRRYYWREIALETMRRFARWAEQHGQTDWQKARERYPEQYAAIEREVLADIKAQHKNAPKYEYREESQENTIRENEVSVVRLDARYTTGDEGRVAVLDGVDVVAVEEYASRHFQCLGYTVLRLESRPVHALFGVYMWLLIQDVKDPKVRMVGIGARAEQPLADGILWFDLPQDFGTPGYGQRRASAIAEHLASLPEDRDELLWLFDYWSRPSESLRQYLHVWESTYLERARRLVETLPPKVILRILRYLVDAYWTRYCGWPDLLIHRQQDWFFAEVKSSRDKLSEDQKRWIRDNHQQLQLPFKLIKIHRERLAAPRRR